MSSGKGHSESHNPQQCLARLNAVLRAIRNVNGLFAAGRLSCMLEFCGDHRQDKERE